MFLKRSTEDVDAVLSDVKQLLLETKTGGLMRFSEQLLKFRRRLKAALALDFESQSRSAADLTSTVTLTLTQHLALWRAYGSLCDAWIDGIEMVALKKDKAKDKKINALQNDVFILCSTKYSELSESCDMELSALPPMPQLSKMEPRKFSDESITSVTTNGGRFFDSIESEEAMLTSAKTRRAADLCDVQSVDGSHVQSVDGSHDPSVSSMISTMSRMPLSAESQRVLRLHATKLCAPTTSASLLTSATAASARRTLSGTAASSSRTKARLKPMAESSTDSLEGGHVFLDYENSTTTPPMATESRAPIATELTVPTTIDPKADDQWIGSYFFDDQSVFETKVKRSSKRKRLWPKKAESSSRKETSKVESSETASSTSSKSKSKSRFKWLGL